MVWWDATEVTCESEEEIWGGRALRVHLKEVRTQRDKSVYAVYMPVRGQKEHAQEVEDAWEALRNRLEREELTWAAVWVAI